MKRKTKIKQLKETPTIILLLINLFLIVLEVGLIENGGFFKLNNIIIILVLFFNTYILIKYQNEKTK